MKCVKKYNSGGPIWPFGRKKGAQCKSSLWNNNEGEREPRGFHQYDSKPKTKRPKLNIVPKQEPKAPNPYEGMNRSERKAAEERAKQRRHAGPRFL